MDLAKLSKSELVDQLEKAREREGKSKSELARELDVSRQTYHRWVNGSDSPNKFNRRKIKTFLARSEAEEAVKKVEEKFNETDEIIKRKLVWATLPEGRWKKLEELEEDKQEDIVTEALEKYLEDKKKKV